MEQSNEAWRDVQLAVLTPVFRELKAQGRTAKWFAERVGVSEKSISHYRYARRRMPQGLLEKMRVTLGNPPLLAELTSPSDAWYQPTRRSHRRRANSKKARGPPRAKPQQLPLFPDS